MLALFGERDLQCPPATHLTAMRDSLARAGNDDATIRRFPGLNHLFQPADTGAIDEYGQIEVTIAPEVLDCVASWIDARFP